MRTFAYIQREPLGEIGGGDGPQAFHPAAHGGQGVVHRIPALGCDPKFAAAAFDGKRASGLDQFVKPFLPFRKRRSGDEGEQRVVEFIRIARLGPDFARNLVDRGGIENALGNIRSCVELRSWTARARRSSSGASSRNA